MQHILALQAPKLAKFFKWGDITGKKRRTDAPQPDFMVQGTGD
jgi:hypothetical protein